MRNIFILILVVLAIALAVYGFTRSNGNNYEENQMENIEEIMMEEDNILEEDTMMEEDKMMAQSGEYVAYNPELLARADSGNVVLFFHAAWCPTCKALENSISKGNIPEDLTILKIDYDSSSELKKKYGIVIQHTLVQVDSQGNEITKWVGGNDLESIESKLQ